MALRKMSISRYEHAVAESKRYRAELLGGSSPGAVARELGISRQAVHKAIHAGHLDALMLYADNGELAAFLIPPASVDAYRRRRELRLANTGPANRG